MRKSNYDKTPSTRIEGKIWIGRSELLNKLKKQEELVISERDL